MGILNQKIDSGNDHQINWMGSRAYGISDPILNLKLAASSCFFGEPMYYHKDQNDRRPIRSGNRTRTLSDTELSHLRDILNSRSPSEWRNLTPSEVMEKAIDAALNHNFNATLDVAISLRNDDNIRTTPQVILVRAANHRSSINNPYLREAAKKIINRADEPAVGLSYQLMKFGKKIPTRLKRVWKDALEKFDEYQLAKYRMEKHEVKTVDVINLVHPASDAVSKLIKGKLKNSDTWESIVSSGGSNKQTWEEALNHMGHMALLRNIRNLLDNGVESDKFLQKLIDGVEGGKQLPFRYFSAYKSVKDSAPQVVLDALERCLSISLRNIESFRGRTVSLCDNSGSAWGSTTSSMGTMHIAEIANLTGVITGMVSDEGYVGVFGDGLRMLHIDKNNSVFEQTANCSEIGRNIGHSTENGIWTFLNRIIQDREHWDNIFIYSDMQAGHGGLYGMHSTEYVDFNWFGSRNIDVPKLIKKYRETVNRNVMVYLVQVAGYQDTIVPDFYDKTFVLGGWGDGLLKFASKMSSL